MRTRLIADERNNHAVKIEEEHDEVEAELDETLLRTPSAFFRSSNLVDSVAHLDESWSMTGV